MPLYYFGGLTHLFSLVNFVLHWHLLMFWSSGFLFGIHNRPVGLSQYGSSSIVLDKDFISATVKDTWVYPSQTHRLFGGITLWAYFSEPLVKDRHKRLGSPEKPQYHVLQVRWSHITVTYVLRRDIQKRCTLHFTERYTETLHMNKMADLVTLSLLTHQTLN